MRHAEVAGHRLSEANSDSVVLIVLRGASEHDQYDRRIDYYDQEQERVARGR